MNREDLDYCAGQVREGDPDRFATAMLAPPEGRARLMALYAFNLEIARLRESVSDILLGEIRLQWWRDALAECRAGTPRRHQVVHPLSHAIAEAALPDGPFLEAIDARARDLDETPPQDDAALAAYIDATGGAIGELAVRCLVGPEATEADIDAGRAAGRAWGWVGLVRGLHVHRRQGRQTVPADRLRVAPTLADDIETATASDAVRDWTRVLLERGREETAVVLALKGQVAKAALPALAPIRLARRYDRGIAVNGYDPFQVALVQMGQARRAASLLPLALFGRL